MSSGPRSDLMVWIDMEMSGLDVEVERVLEVAVVLTDSKLDVVATGPELVVHQSDEVLAAMDEWNTEHHGASGLTARVRESSLTETEAEDQVLAFLEQHCVAGSAPLAGNSVWQDRRFIAKFMPRVDAHMHYRIIDVSSVKELCRRWRPEIVNSSPQKREAHRALEDILESIEELRHYKSTLFP